ncbi:hypothetical protein [Candidatus Palauibacter sp.]|uniref:hypothetical protein n=1 Tax=Candidatus Palauibacter sp. TaxID=3101350 RepID=UPI003B022118
MTEKETEGLALLEHYAVDADGRVILTGLAESIRVANAFQQTQWVPTARKFKGWTVNLRTGQIFALTLRTGEVEILLLPEMLRDEERKALEEAAHGKYEPKHPPGSARYTLDLTAARKLWGSIERAHHAVLQQGRHPSGAKNNPEANALIDYLKRKLDLDLPYPDRELVGTEGEDEAHPKPARTLLEAYAASDEGRAILTSMAKSIRTAHADNPANWCTTVLKSAGYIALNVGNACAIRLHGDEIRILLMPEDLDEGVRARLEAATHHSWNRKAVPGARNYMLRWPQAAELWDSLEEAHHAAIRAAHRKSATSQRNHSSAIVDGLNRILGLDLPQPDYGPYSPEGKPNPGENGMQATRTNTVDFDALIQALRDAKLHFSSEVVANYVLALQAKRFAILTGISGTGKTQIAMAVARSFPATVRDQPAAELVRSTAPDDAVRMTARPFHFKWLQIVLPVRFVAEVESLLPPEPASRLIEVAYPSGVTKLRFYREPNRNVTWLLFAGAHEFRDWYVANLRPGDEYLISFREGETPEKHRIEFRLAEAEVTERELDNRVVVPVRPDWVDNRGLLGYFNPLSNEYSTTPFLSLLLEAQAEEERAEKEERDPHPFFVVLDEMNLARVEHYFSDFLSALESGEPIPLHESEEVEEGRTESGPVVPRQLRVPSNVFFTGTVNVDETTYMFSPKVLDRAFTIEFDRVDLDGFTTGIHADEEAGLSLDGGDGELRLTPYRKPGRDDWRKFSQLHDGRFHRTLLELHGILEEEHRHFGYRVANEIARFVDLAHEQSADGEAAAEAAFDLALLQKVLPKFHGTQQELEPILRRLASALGATPEDASEHVPAGTSAADPEASTEGRAARFPRTVAKIRRMLKRLEQRGFTSFIE